MTRHFRFRYRSSFGVRSGKVVMIAMAVMISMVVTTIKVVAVVVGGTDIFKKSGSHLKIIGATGGNKK